MPEQPHQIARNVDPIAKLALAAMSTTLVVVRGQRAYEVAFDGAYLDTAYSYSEAYQLCYERAADLLEQNVIPTLLQQREEARAAREIDEGIAFVQQMRMVDVQSLYSGWQDAADVDVAA